MEFVNANVKFFLNLAKTQTILNNRFDRGLGGLSFGEFLILFYLDQAENQKMRRVDIAEKVCMTASGITRMLLPMEKVGLIKSGPIEQDARARFAQLASGGKRHLNEALERLRIFAEEIIPASKPKEIKNFSDLLIEIGGKALMV